MADFLKRRPHAPLAMIAAVMLLVAFGHWPYAYYKVLRWVSCAAAVWVMWQCWDWQISWATGLFGLVAILFNPLAPIHLDRMTWQVLDAIAAGLFVLSAVLLKEPPRRN